MNYQNKKSDNNREREPRLHRVEVKGRNGRSNTKRDLMREANEIVSRRAA